jgi:pyruvate kinase
MKRNRKAKIVATLGPVSTTKAAIRALFDAGDNAFRFNFSHGAEEDHQRRCDSVREIDRETDLADVQGPELPVGALAADPVRLSTVALQQYLVPWITPIIGGAL